VSGPVIDTEPVGPARQRRVRIDGATAEIDDDARGALADGNDSTFETRTSWRVSRASGLLLAEQSETHARNGRTGASVLQARVLRTLEPASADGK
jgi:hypothetical protein